MSNLGALKITILDTATIFEGIDTIYRYDLPGSGVEEGWAVNAVIEQIRDLYAAVWPDVEIVIDGSEAATDMLSRSLLNKGVTAYSIEAFTDPVIQESGAQANLYDLVQIRRPTENTQRFQLTRFHAVLAGVAVAVLAGVVILVSAAMRADAPASSASVTSSAARSTTGTTSSVATSESSTPTPPTPPVVLELHNVAVSVPSEFIIEPREDGLLQLTGPDPELRILVAADPIYSVEPAAIHREIEHMVEHDPTLNAQQDEQVRGPEVLTQTYREDPGDGSSVLWVTWVQDRHQFSVGCHSRNTASISHKAACRMAVETLRLRG